MQQRLQNRRRIVLGGEVLDPADAEQRILYRIPRDQQKTGGADRKPEQQRALKRAQRFSSMKMAGITRLSGGASARDGIDVLLPSLEKVAARFTGAELREIVIDHFHVRKLRYLS